MMNFYIRYTKVIVNGEVTFEDSYQVMCDSKKAQDRIIKADWNNVEKVLDEDGWSPFVRIGVYRTKKGLKIRYPYDWNYRTIRQWKSPLNIAVEITYKIDHNAQIRDLKYAKIEDVIQYFTERGVNFPLDKLV